MGRMHRAQGKVALLYYLPCRFRPLWEEARSKGYTLRDIVVVGLLIIHRHPDWAKIRVRVRRPSPRTYSIRVPTVVIHLIQEGPNASAGKQSGEAGTEGRPRATSED